MSEEFEGKGYLFRDTALVSPVRYRLRSGRDDWGQSHAEGELWMPVRQAEKIPADHYVLHTEDGFTLPLEVTGGASEGWLPFRRSPRKGGRDSGDGVG